jgi:type IV secretory pathway TrbF-like protein
MSTTTTSTWRPDPEPSTPYRRARQEWDDRMGSAIVHARNWRLASFATLAALFVAILGMIYLGRLPKAVPHIIEVDHLGGATYRGPVGETQYTPSDAVVRYHLQRFVENTRTISSDVAVLKKNWFDAYTAVTPKAANMLTAYVQAPEHDPFRRAQEGRVTLQTVSTVRVSQDTWQLDWRETTWDTHGTPVGAPTLWRGMFKISLQPPTTEAAMAANPIGLYVDEFHWDTVAR